jgi:hypothetical protein
MQYTLYAVFLICRSCDRASVMYSYKYNQKVQRYTIFFITVNALHVSGLLAATARGSSLARTRCCVYSS